MRRNLALVAMASVALLGCGRSGPPDTGAREMAQKYLDAFCKQDWAGDYAMLDAQARGKINAEQFTAWISSYHQRLGFEVETSVVHSCEEVGDQAMANATLGGHKGGRQVTKNTAVWLQHGAAGWGVVVPEEAGGGNSKSEIRASEMPFGGGASPNQIPNPNSQ